jgi:ActR/RegA family two-component response regulator
MKRVGTSDFDKPRVLLVDDEAAFAAMLRYNLETRGDPQHREPLS